MRRSAAVVVVCLLISACTGGNSVTAHGGEFVTRLPNVRGASVVGGPFPTESRSPTSVPGWMIVLSTPRNPVAAYNEFVDRAVDAGFRMGGRWWRACFTTWHTPDPGPTDQSSGRSRIGKQLPRSAVALDYRCQSVGRRAGRTLVIGGRWLAQDTGTYLTIESYEGRLDETQSPATPLAESGLELPPRSITAPHPVPGEPMFPKHTAFITWDPSTGNQRVLDVAADDRVVAMVPHYQYGWTQAIVKSDLDHNAALARYSDQLAAGAIQPMSPPRTLRSGSRRGLYQQVEIAGDGPRFELWAIPRPPGSLLLIRPHW